MTDLSGRNILVLGGSGALGALIVGRLLSRGANVMATTTSTEHAARIPAGVSPMLLLDLAKPETISTLVNYLIQNDIQVDGIVNATGLVAFGLASDLSVDALLALASVNLTGPILLISGLIPALRNSALSGRSPFVLNISGIVAENPMAGMAAYSASKAGLFAFGQALGRELRKDGIRVIDARPGHTETGLAERAIEGVAPKFAEGMNPESVAERIVSAIENDELDLPSGAFRA